MSWENVLKRKDRKDWTDREAAEEAFAWGGANMILEDMLKWETNPNHFKIATLTNKKQVLGVANKGRHEVEEYIFEDFEIKDDEVLAMVRGPKAKEDNYWFGKFHVKFTFEEDEEAEYGHRVKFATKPNYTPFR